MASLDVCAAVVFRGGKLLLATRPAGSHNAGLWEFPGGKCNPGETFEACIARELHEELALTVTEATAVGTISAPLDDGSRTLSLHFMRCGLSADSEALPQEGQKAAWFAPSEWSDLSLAPLDKEFLQTHRADLTGLAQESSNDAVPGRLPAWLKTSFEGGAQRMAVRNLLRGGGLHTVCEGAKCPNRCECWRHRTATFMILGNTCSRACKFCSVNHGRPEPPDPLEATHIAESVAELGLKYVVVTCVTRDDLPDGGASAMRDVILAIRERCPDTLVEVLVSDYNADFASVDLVTAARPAVFGHNLETVERLTPSVRSVARYRRSLDVLSHAAEQRTLPDRPPMAIKSGMMLGLGETPEEIRQALKDLRMAGVSIVTLGQYLQPTPAQLPVQRLIPPSEFLEWRRYAEEELGFARAVCGPLVRSSYLAGEAYFEAVRNR